MEHRVASGLHILIKIFRIIGMTGGLYADETLFSGLIPGLQPVV